VKRERLLLDHRWGECENLADGPALRAAIVDAYGNALEWNDLDAIENEFLDLRKTTSDSRRFFLNAPTSTADAWFAEYEWAARADPMKVIADGDVVTVGFDGSRQRARGVTDATALIGCRVADGHIFEIRIWEQPSNIEDWEVPTTEVDAEVRNAFARFKVVGFYADPAKWESQLSTWEAAFGLKLRVKATQQHPIHWWMSGGRRVYTARALEQFRSAALDGGMTHDGSSALTRHILNARMRSSAVGLQIGKDFPDSVRKIDAAVAATLAWQARVEALAQGLGARTTPGRGRIITLG